MANGPSHRSVGRPREFDENVALESAMDAFWRKGYEATSLTDLCEYTGMNKASLYRVFGDKHRLFKSALQHYAEKEFRAVIAVVDDSKSPLTNIRAVVHKITADVDAEKGCMMINSMVELATHDATVQQMLAGFGEKRINAMTDMINRAQQLGEIRPELVPGKLARNLMITLAGSAAMVKGFMEENDILENLDDLIDSWT